MANTNGMSVENTVKFVSGGGGGGCLSRSRRKSRAMLVFTFLL